jgi:hypothetical protein
MASQFPSSEERPSLLLARLGELASSLSVDHEALGLLGLGSVGVELGRLDEWSDLDFFVIVAKGSKPRWLEGPEWLGVRPLLWSFRNTVDGFKLLWEDGVFAEMAVFEPEELGTIPFAEGRWVWRREGLDAGLRLPANPAGRRSGKDPRWSVGEALSCLYVGLCRFHRGEALSAFRFLQQHCLDRFLELVDHLDEAEGSEAARAEPDPFDRNRRFETRHPELRPLLESMLGGYGSLPRSALALLDWLETRFPVEKAMSAEIRRLAGDQAPPKGG